AEALRQEIEKSNSPAGVKFHALAPEEKCNAEKMHDYYYFDLVDATGGIKIDPCKTAEFAGPISTIVDSSTKVAAPSFVLSKTVDKILKVLVNDKETTAYTLGA